MLGAVTLVPINIWVISSIGSKLLIIASLSLAFMHVLFFKDEDESIDNEIFYQFCLNVIFI